jgi:hypothetical protein
MRSLSCAAIDTSLIPQIKENLKMRWKMGEQIILTSAVKMHNRKLYT